MKRSERRIYRYTIKIATALLITGLSVTSLIGIGAGSSKGKFVGKTGQDLSYVKGEVLVKFKQGLTEQVQSKTLQTLGGVKSEFFQSTRVSRIKLPEGDNVEAALNRYRNNPNIEYVQPNYIYKSMAVPNDTSYGEQWGLKNTGQIVTGSTYTTGNPGFSGFDMSIEQVWDHRTDCSSVTVAVIDSGVNYNQEDITGNMWTETPGSCKSDSGVSIACPNHGWDFIDGDDDPMDMNGHGTHISGIIGASGNNGTGGTGVCWKSSIMAVRVLDAGGIGTSVSILQGLNYAINNDAKIINMSLGGPSYDSALYSAIQLAGSKDILIIVAAGNDGTDNSIQPVYPCNFNSANIICVTAVDQRFNKATFGNYSSTYVDLGAPGTNILSPYYGVDTEILEDFSLNWTLTGWVHDSPGCFGVPYDTLNSPATYCSFGVPTNGSYTASKMYDFSAFSMVVASFYADYYLDYMDWFRFDYNAAGGLPSLGISNQIGSSADSNGYYYYSFDLNGCTTATCNIGFNYYNSTLSTNNAGNGSSVTLLTFTGKNPGISSYRIESGSSMATAYATGLAALIRAQNPLFTYLDIRKSIFSGGRAVASLSSTGGTPVSSGGVVNAWGAFSYLSIPMGLTATVP